MKAHYAFNEQVAMVDFTYNENKSNDKPLAKARHETKLTMLQCLYGPYCNPLTIHSVLQAYIKAPAGQNGFGPLSVGFIVDKTIDV